MEYAILTGLALLFALPPAIAHTRAMKRVMEVNRRNRQTAIEAHKAVLAEHRSAMEFAKLEHP